MPRINQRDLRSLPSLGQHWGPYMRGHTRNMRGFGATAVEQWGCRCFLILGAGGGHARNI